MIPTGKYRADTLPSCNGGVRLAWFVQRRAQTIGGRLRVRLQMAGIPRVIIAVSVDCVTATTWPRLRCVLCVYVCASIMKFVHVYALARSYTHTRARTRTRTQERMHARARRAHTSNRARTQHTRTHARTHARMHACMHTCMHAHINTRTKTSTNTHKRTHERTHIHTHTYTLIQPHARTHTHKQTHRHTQTQTHTHRHRHRHRETHTHTHTHTHTRTYTTVTAAQSYIGSVLQRVASVLHCVAMCYRMSTCPDSGRAKLLCHQHHPVCLCIQ